ncbi:MAG: hypothetical protein JXR81_03670 [Candidatus Goldbacteria bacterium]|nr:hypothetical protein [Candidatus Goldiibacteriota bacterium]
MKNVFFVSLLFFFTAGICSCEKAAIPSAAAPDDVKQHISSLTGLSGFSITKQFVTGFEAISDFDSFYIVPDGYLGTTYHSLTNSSKHGGSYSHFAFINGSNSVTPYLNTNHRGYPTIQLYKTQGAFQGAVFCEFYVKLNITLTASADMEWFSFATLTSYGDDYWSRTVLVNLDYNNIVRLMHMPAQGQSVCDIYQTDTVTFPMNEWVKLSILLDYTSDNEYLSPYAKVWQNDVLVSGARFNPRVDPSTIDTGWWPDCLTSPVLWAPSDGIEAAESRCGLNYTAGLAQAHFGMYAPPLLTGGEVWNDDLVIYEITR